MASWAPAGRAARPAAASRFAAPLRQRACGWRCDWRGRHRERPAAAEQGPAVQKTNIRRPDPRWSMACR